MIYEDEYVIEDSTGKIIAVAFILSEKDEHENVLDAVLKGKWEYKGRESRTIMEIING